jgi:hypothetical protein
MVLGDDSRWVVAERAQVVHAAADALAVAAAAFPRAAVGDVIGERAAREGDAGAANN